MRTHREKRRLPYTADELYALVADVGRYPEFLPWVSQARIISHDTGEGGEVMIADLTISFKVHREHFRSEVKLDRTRHIIRTRYIDGPFKHMRNEWRFTPDGAGSSNIDFFIEFEFKNKALQLLIGVLFEEAVKRIVMAFEHRAWALYGRRKLAVSAAG